MLLLFPFLDESKRDPDHATAATAAATAAAAAAAATATKCAVPHAAAPLADGLADAKRGPPVRRPVPFTATTATTDQQPIKQQYAADYVLLVGSDGERRLEPGLPKLVLVTYREIITYLKNFSIQLMLRNLMNGITRDK